MHHKLPLCNRQVMADVYASAVGTTVLQLKEIPLRPPEFDGAVCLFGLKPEKKDDEIREALEKKIRKALKCFGTIKGIELNRDPAVVRFTTHEAALQAEKEGLPELCGGIGTLYNERSYDGRKGEANRSDDDGRGWCGRNQQFQPALNLSTYLWCCIPRLF